MGRPARTFLHFLTDYSGNCYVLDTNGNVIKVANTWINHSPKEWKDQQISWGRNSIYYGLNRTFTTAYSFVEDGATILRSLLYTGRGIEEPVWLLVLKWNADTDIYETYYKTEVDLSQFDDSSATDFKVNLLEGGLVKLLKSYENTQFRIPMDGSLAEHYKVNIDGILFDDVFHFKIVPLNLPYTPVQLFSPMSTVFVGNDGDNIGIIHGDQSFNSETDTHWYVHSGNYLFSSIDAINLFIKGSITVEADDPSLFARFQMKFLTSNMGTIADDTLQLLSHSTTNGYLHFVSNRRTYTFSKSIFLPANVNLFLTFLNEITTSTQDQQIRIIDGTFDIQFSSKYKNTAPWCISAYNVFKILVKNICQYASEADGFTYDYGIQSQLLSEFLGFSITSGDALRASADPNYTRFFNPESTDTNQVINNYTSFGPTMKTTLKEFFTAMNSILNASLGTRYNADGDMVAFIERKDYVFDSTSVDFDLGEVSNFKCSLAQDYIFDILKIGYPEQQYDEKQGKYEYNTTLQMRSPIKRIQRELNLVCPYRTDSYGIEYTRFNTTKDSKSTTYNNSDSSVFLLNADTSGTPVYDGSVVETLEGGLPTVPNVIFEDIPLIRNISGAYFAQHDDNAVFQVRAQVIADSRTFNITYAGLISGRVGDSITIEFVFKGLTGSSIDSRTYTITAPGQYIGGSVAGETFALVLSISAGDVFYIRVTSTNSAQVTFNDNTRWDIDGTTFVASIIGTTTLPPGVYHQPLAFDSCSPDPKAQTTQIDTGFSYLTFNESIANRNFDWKFDILSVYQANAVAQLVQFDLYILTTPGVVGGVGYAEGHAYHVEHIPLVGAGSIYTDNTLGNVDFDYNDIVFAKYSQSANVNLGGIVGAIFTITSLTIRLYNLKRRVYDSVFGIPNPTTAYNIEDLTPKRMLERHGDYIRGALFQQQSSRLKFLSLSKNESLFTNLAGVVFNERAEVEIDELDDPLFYPYVFTFQTMIPDGFAELMTNAVNAHGTFTYNGIRFYGFPVKCSVKPALNESQQWQMLASPLNTLSDLVDLSLNGFNLVNLMQYGVTVAHLNPVKFVPITTVVDPRYNSRHMDHDWYINQINLWSSKKNYYQKWQTNDTINFQLIANASGPAIITIIDCNGKKIGADLNMTVVTTDALKDPYILYQISIPLIDIPVGTIYLIATVGTGTATTRLISEGMEIAVLHDDTLLLEYTNNKNKQAVVFDNFSPNMRVEGQIIRMVPGMNMASYEDEPAEEFVLDGVPFRSFTFVLGGKSPIPSWMIDKVSRITGLNSWFADGIEYSRVQDSNFEPTSYPGQALQYWTLEIRQSKNLEAGTLTPDGALENNLFAVYNINTAAFGDLSSQVSDNVIQVEHVD